MTERTERSERTKSRKRQKEILEKAALQAYRLPTLPSGLWFHSDIRDNFYYASALLAASCDLSMELPFEREEGKRRASEQLGRVLAMQDMDPASATYGHWPLHIPAPPLQAEPHVLPVELMGGLMVYMHREYGRQMGESLSSAFETAFRCIYEGGFFRKEIEHYSHHEAKFTAAKLIFGQRFQDSALLEDGKRSLRLTMLRLKEKGMPEYGCLPWFWHWVQAFTCAWELSEDPELRSELELVLDWLWEERANFYLKGAWAGPRSRSWPHDMPKDSNVLFDYVQFGDFQLPDAMSRLEFAGFLYYEAPEQARRTALDRSAPREVVRQIYPTGAGEGKILHSYTYLTERFAVGGIRERVREFDNEQLRFTITLPVQAASCVNQAYFFHPSVGYDAARKDMRHQSEHMDVLVVKNTVLALFPIPSDADDRVVGVLPKGDWTRSDTAHLLCGYACGVYFVIHGMQPFELEEREDRVLVGSRGRANGVVMEVIDPRHKTLAGVTHLQQLLLRAQVNPPVWEVAPLRVAYRNAEGATLTLEG